MNDNTIKFYEKTINNLNNQINEFESKLKSDQKLDPNEKLKFLNLKTTILKLQVEILNHTKASTEDLDRFVAVDKMNEELQALAKRVGMLKSQIAFSAQDKINRKFNQADQIAQEILQRVQNYFSRQLRGFIFSGASRAKKDKALPAKIAREKQVLRSLESKLEEIDKHLNDLEIQLAISDTSVKDKFVDLKILTFEKEREKLLDEIAQFKDKIGKNEVKLDQYLYYQKKNEQVRAHFETLGGEQIAFKTSDDVRLEGMYLDANKFRNTLAKAGCEIVTFDTPDKIQALAISGENYNKEGHLIHTALEGLNALAQGALDAEDKVAGSGWTFVRSPTRALFVRSDTLPDPTDNTHPFFKYDASDEEWKFNEPGTSVREVVEKLDTESPATSSIILTSGSLATFEMQKSEAMYYLLKNMNVMMFNFRGYGNSEGTPTMEGLQIDMETAFQFLKEKSKHEDRQILLKALCLSGGPASSAAAQHPDCHIFLDQSYSSFKKLVKDVVVSLVEDYFDQFHVPDESTVKSFVLDKLKNSLKHIAASVVSLATPDLSTAKNLTENRGHKALFFIQDDTMIDTRHIEKNIKALSEAGQCDYLTVMTGPGVHGQSILGIETQPLDYFYTAEIRALEKQEKKLLSSAENIEEEDKDKADLLKSKANELKEQRQALIGEILDRVGIDLASESTMATHAIQKQVNYFLTNARLSSELVKTSKEIGPLPPPAHVDKDEGLDVNSIYKTLKINEVKYNQFEMQLDEGLDIVEQYIYKYQKDYMALQVQSELERAVKVLKTLQSKIDDKMKEMAQLKDDLTHQVLKVPTIDTAQQEYEIYNITQRVQTMNTKLMMYQQMIKNGIKTSEMTLNVGRHLKQLLSTFDIWQRETKAISDRAFHLANQLPLELELNRLSPLDEQNFEHLGARFKELSKVNEKMNQKLAAINKQENDALKALDGETSLDESAKLNLKQVVKRNYGYLQQQLADIVKNSGALLEEWTIAKNDRKTV